MIAARSVLQRAEERRAETHQIGGYLSELHGVLPYDPPRTSLPGSHAAWDEMAAQLPELFRSVAGREALEAMPVLEAGPDALPDEALWRAIHLLSHFAHTYVLIRPDPPANGLPPSIAEPWAELSRRMGRPATVLTYDDLLLSNWKLRDPDGPRRLENMDVLTPTLGSREERNFYLMQVELHDRGSPIVGAVVRAQEAAVAEDHEALEQELALIVDVLDDCTRLSFMKVDPNPNSPTHVDPVIWAKTVAQFSVAIDTHVHAISGAAAPLFQIVDAFVGRNRYDSRIGHEFLDVSVGFPPDFRAFLAGLREVSVGEAVARSGSHALQGLWHATLEAYAGDRGFLGTHRLKTYAYLETAFKVGHRSVINTGSISRLFEDQMWARAHRELEASRRERWESVARFCPVVTPAGTEHDELTAEGISHLRIAVGDAGLRYRAGDRLAVLPEQDPELVDKTLAALRAGGDEPIRLDSEWRAALIGRGLDPPPDELPLQQLLAYARLRPVSREVAKALRAFSGSERLTRILDAHAESSWELWDLLEMLADGPFDPRDVWRADPWDEHGICKVAPPELERVYSLSSSMRGEASAAAQSVELLAAELTYTTAESDVSHEALRHGSGSRFLSRLAHGSDPNTRFPVRVVRSSRFRLPQDVSVPIVMFAGGAGLSAFRGFVQDRMTAEACGDAWLLLSTRSDRHVDLYRRDFADAIETGRLRFDAVVTASAQPGKGGIAGLIAENADRLAELLRGPEAIFYICGPVGLAASILAALEQITDADTIDRRIGEGRLLQDVFTAPQPEPGQEPMYDVSEIVRHNDRSHGIWCVIDDKVYDLTRFADQHPGGDAIVKENAGRDATGAYREIEHHLDPEIEAMLGLYRIGHVRPLRFGGAGAIAVGPEGLVHVRAADVYAAWVEFLYLVVEIEDSLFFDFRILDDVTVAGDPEGQLTFLKAQLLLEAQEHFPDVYIPSLLGPNVHRLWAMTAALCAPELPADALERELAAVAARPEAAAARTGVFAEGERLHGLGLQELDARVAELERMARLRTKLEEADWDFIRLLKQVAVRGVRPFEEWEAEAPARAGRGLLAPLESLPAIVAGFDDALAVAFAIR
ncbi:MAG TPA: cytochrome b5 domain-containing protein [Gaiellaceae bacterium]